MRSDAAFRALSRPDFPVRTRIVLEDAERAGTVTAADSPDPLGGVTIESYEPERVRINIDAARACYLFLADTFYSEWEALIDGAPTRIYPADLTFRAVEVPAGSHRVEFRYRRQAFYRGLTFSGIGLALLIVWGAIFRRRQGESLPLTDGLPGGGRAALAVLLMFFAVLAGSVFIKRSLWVELPSPGAEPVFFVHTYQWEVE